MIPNKEQTGNNEATKLEELKKMVDRIADNVENPTLRVETIANSIQELIDKSPKQK